MYSQYQLLGYHAIVEAICAKANEIGDVCLYKRLVERVIARCRKAGFVENQKSTYRKRTVGTPNNIKKKRIGKNRQLSIKNDVKFLRLKHFKILVA